MELKERLQNKLMIAALALMSLLCISCSTPPVYNTPSEDGTAWWAYQQCLAASSASCNMVGVTPGRSYTDYTFGANLTPTTSTTWSNKFYRAIRAQSYHDYLQALPADVQEQMKTKWLELAQSALDT